MKKVLQNSQKAGRISSSKGWKETLSKILRKLIRNLFGYHIAFSASRPLEFGQWQMYRATGVFYSFVHGVIDVMMYVWRFIAKVVFYVSIPIVALGAITGISSQIVLLFEPIMKKINRSRGQEIEDRLGIIYHNVHPSYTVEQTKEILKIKSDEMDAIIGERTYFIENYLLPLIDGWEIHITRSGEFDFYKLETSLVDSVDKKISLHFREKKFKGKKTEHLATRIIKYDKEFIGRTVKSVKSYCVKNGAPKEQIKFLVSDISKIQNDGGAIEGISFLGYAIREFLSLKEIQKIKYSDNDNREKVTEKIANETLYDIYREELSS